MTQSKHQQRRRIRTVLAHLALMAIEDLGHTATDEQITQDMFAQIAYGCAGLGRRTARSVTDDEIAAAVAHGREHAALLPKHVVAAGYSVAQIEEAVRGGYAAFLDEAAVEIGVCVARLQRWAAVRQAAAA